MIRGDAAPALRALTRLPAAAQVGLYNPLPEALGHYEQVLLDILSSAGVSAMSVGAPSVELGRASLAQRLGGAVVDLVGRARSSGRADHLLVCWPTYGLLDPALWWPVTARARVSIIVHDPKPLRRQIGMGGLARILGGAATRPGRVRVIAHSEPAVADLTAMGWSSPTLLPHPLSASRSRPRPADANTVLVCGQYKPSRHSTLLARLGGPLADRGYRAVISGRGWPTVPGWTVEDRFLSEAELDERIGGSATVLIPYTHFYQSGIAVRAVELGVPVVGPEHPFLRDLLGPAWPGLVGPDDPVEWADAVASAAPALSALASSRAAFHARCVHDWADHFANLAS